MEGVLTQQHFSENLSHQDRIFDFAQNRSMFNSQMVGFALKLESEFPGVLSMEVYRPSSTFQQILVINTESFTFVKVCRFWMRDWLLCSKVSILFSSIAQYGEGTNLAAWH